MSICIFQILDIFYQIWQSTTAIGAMPAWAWRLHDILNEYEKRFEYAKNNTSSPDSPNYKEIEAIQIAVNENIING